MWSVRLMRRPTPPRSAQRQPPTARRADGSCGVYNILDAQNRGAPRVRARVVDGRTHADRQAEGVRRDSADLVRLPDGAGRRRRHGQTGQVSEVRHDAGAGATRVRVDVPGPRPDQRSAGRQLPDEIPPISYVCPMEQDADVVMDKPGKCPKCGMTRSEEHTSELQSHSFISYAV